MPEIEGLNSDVHFGDIDRPLPDWREDDSVVLDEDPDDELIATPEDVKAVLGFDPLDVWKKDEDEIEEKYNPGQPRDSSGRWTSGGGGTAGGSFFKADSVSSAENWAKANVANEVRYDGLDLDAANQINEALYDHIAAPGRDKLHKVATLDLEDKAVAVSIGDTILINSRYMTTSSHENFVRVSNDAVKKSRKEALAKVEDRMKDTLVDLMRQGVHPNDLRDHPRVLELDAASRAIGLSPGSRRAFVGDSVKDTMVHELGHVLHERMLGGGTDREMFGALGGSKDAVDKSGIFPLAQLTPKARADAGKISAYAKANHAEYFAEAWAAYHKGESSLLSPEVKGFVEEVITNAR